MVAASAAVSRETNTIHTICEIDITEPRRRMREHQEQTGERLSLTAYIVTCLARTVAEDRTFNSRRRGGRLYVLDDVTISALVERELDGRSVPEPLAIQMADKKTLRQIHDELRSVSRQSDRPLGALGGMAWVIRLIPSFLFKLFVRAASKSIGMAKRYGVVGVTAVGMFGPSPMWLVPLSSATVAVAVGSIVEHTVLIDGQIQVREHLCLTLSFNHDIIDGAPAARFAKRLADRLSGGAAVLEA
jgi:pyruvate/2-oxoglutarate dehydrogenase complex dihydrolipoamide acyltransferase (E2) component